MLKLGVEKVRHGKTIMRTTQVILLLYDKSYVKRPCRGSVSGFHHLFSHPAVRPLPVLQNNAGQV